MLPPPSMALLRRSGKGAARTRHAPPLLPSRQANSGGSIGVVVSEAAVVRAYERISPEAYEIREVAYRFGGPRRPRKASDHLGFDLLNGGLRQVWTLAEGLGLGSDSRALEVGCGLGGPMRFLAERYECTITGVDASPRQLAIARALTAGLAVERELEFVHADAGALPFAAESFTHVYSIEAFFHVADKRAAFAEAFRVLAPGGVFCLQDFIVHDRSLEIPMLERAVHALPVDAYLSHLEDVGFVDVDALDRTRQSWLAFGMLAKLTARGSISPRRAFAALSTVHPGVRPPLARFLAPARARHLLRYLREPDATLRELIGPERLRGAERMFADVTAAYERGALSFYEFRARKPARA
jgi:SAM-dependent methyltransferase